jgi:hypothetical protein
MNRQDPCISHISPQNARGEIWGTRLGGEGKS